MRSHDPHDPIDAVVDDAKAGLADAIAAEQAALRPDFAAILEEARRRVTSGGATSAADRLEDLRLRDADDDLDGDDDFAADAALQRPPRRGAGRDRRRPGGATPPLPPAPPHRARPREPAALARPPPIAAPGRPSSGRRPLPRPSPRRIGAGGLPGQYRDRVDGGPAARRARRPRTTRPAAEAVAAGPPRPGRTCPKGPVRRPCPFGPVRRRQPSPRPALVDEASAAAGDPADAAPRADEAVEADAAPAPEVQAERPTDAGALEREVEARWRAGDLAGAERALRSIIRDVHDRRRVDLAYGDLFTITRQLHGREREAAVWREYLRRYPRGHYADDARAGLCRRAEGEALAPCWDRYLADFPAGAHRAEAERERGAP
ncbi:MAG: hypothetical protein R3B09_08475 [Nannocystaceae bacterium]